jgi:hypothetical protein
MKKCKHEMEITICPGCKKEFLACSKCDKNSEEIQNEK